MKSAFPNQGSSGSPQGSDCSLLRWERVLCSFARSAGATAPSRHPVERFRIQSTGQQIWVRAFSGLCSGSDFKRLHDLGIRCPSWGRPRAFRPPTAPPET